MKFAIATVLAFAAAVLAQPKLTNSKFDVVEGQPFTITWTNAEGPVTLTLKNGDPKDLKDVSVIKSGLTGEEFTWTPENLPSDTYAIEITDASGVPNYSVPFEYSGTGTPTSSAPASSTPASSTVTSKASSSVASSTVTSAESSSTTESSSSITTSTTSTTTRSAPTSIPTNQNSEGQRFSSPLALLLVTVAAVMFFN